MKRSVSNDSYMEVDWVRILVAEVQVEDKLGHLMLVDRLDTRWGSYEGIFKVFHKRICNKNFDIDMS